jgi:hypothetical protein
MTSTLQKISKSSKIGPLIFVPTLTQKIAKKPHLYFSHGEDGWGEIFKKVLAWQKSSIIPYKKISVHYNYSYNVTFHKWKP